MASLPEVPWFEGDRLAERLDAIGADAETRAFATTLAETGVAKIDLGDEGRALCDRVVADTDGYFAKPGVARVQDVIGQPDLAQHRVDVAEPARARAQFRGRVGVEVAVAAARLAERDVDVEAERRATSAVEHVARQPPVPRGRVTGR